MATKPLNQITDELWDIEQKIAAANGVVRRLEQERYDLENEALEALDQNKLVSIQGKYAKITIAEAVKPKAFDFDALYAFVLRNKCLHLFERRISAKAYTEIKETLGKDIPGMSEVIIRKIKVNKV